jgi:hypothetical protein
MSAMGPPISGVGDGDMIKKTQAPAGFLVVGSRILAKYEIFNTCSSVRGICFVLREPTLPLFER